MVHRTQLISNISQDFPQSYITFQQRRQWTIHISVPKITVKRSKPRKYNSKNSSMGCRVSCSCENSNAFLNLDAMNRTQNDEENFRILFGPAIATLTDKWKKDFNGVKPQQSLNFKNVRMQAVVSSNACDWQIFDVTARLTPPFQTSSPEMSHQPWCCDSVTCQRADLPSQLGFCWLSSALDGFLEGGISKGPALYYFGHIFPAALPRKQKNVVHFRPCL